MRLNLCRLREVIMTNTETEVVKKKVIVLGSGPIRIGQGIEFDYASVHAVRALREAGYEAIIINNNPETVSTDFDTSDRLYFEPLTPEDVLNVIERESPPGEIGIEGVICQFGGQTAINLARPLSEAGVPILGSSFDSIDLAGRAVLSTEAALEVAGEVGYPVLVRPSYVLGGRAMEIVYNDDDLKEYMHYASDIADGAPILVDRYIVGKEAEVDVIADGIGGCLLPGIMEHIERAGVHSGDSMAVYPPQTIKQSTIDQMVSYATQLALALKVVGLMNIQFVIENDQAYVIEVNPRASRTVPYLSKITGIPMVRAATWASLGKSLAEQGYANGLHPNQPNIAVKAPVFSFSKLTDVDINLGPEMKSTGEILGIDTDFSRALYKAMVASGIDVPAGGKGAALLVTLADPDKAEALPIIQNFAALGFALHATAGTARFLESHGLTVRTAKKISEGTPNLLSLIRGGQVSLLINTVSKDKQIEKEATLIRRASVEHSIPCLTSLDTARALHTALATRHIGEAFEVMTVDRYTG